MAWIQFTAVVVGLTIDIQYIYMTDYVFKSMGLTGWL